MLPIAVLVGGLAKRLQPATETIPIALVKFAGESFILSQYKFLREKGILKIMLGIGYFGEKNRSVVSDSARFGLEVTYSLDDQVLLGAVGAFKQELPLVGAN